MGVFSKAKKSIGFYIKNTDRLLLLLCSLASAYGVCLVYSAVTTAGMSASGYKTQIIASVLGIIFAVIISQIDYENICVIWPILGGFALLLMILTFTPLGLNVSGTDDTAWLAIPGTSITIQPSEFMKIIFIITFSKHLSLVREHINRPLTVLLLCLHAMFPAALVFIQGDDGTAVVFLLMFAAMMFAAGLKPVYFLSAVIAGCAAVPFLWQRLSEDKKNRFLCLIFVDEHRERTGWQQEHGLIAMGSGQLWGVGFAEGGKDSSVFARNNDFIFTVAGEEFGFLGAMAVILLLVFIVFEIWRCAITARDRLGMFICVGVMSMIAFQSLINIGMTLRLLPVLGITLPFFSAGGTSVLSLYWGIGLVLSVYFSSRARARNTIFMKNKNE